MATFLGREDFEEALAVLSNSGIPICRTPMLVAKEALPTPKDEKTGFQNR